MNVREVLDITSFTNYQLLQLIVLSQTQEIVKKSSEIKRPYTSPQFVQMILEKINMICFPFHILRSPSYGCFLFHILRSPSYSLESSSLYK